MDEPHVLLARAGWDVRQKGMNGAPRLLVFTTEQSHSSIAKAVELLGFGNDSIIQVSTNSEYSMDVGALAKLVRTECDARRASSIVVASAGTVNAGAVDPINDIADFCAENGYWLHVDGGLWGAGHTCRRNAPSFQWSSPGGLHRCRSSQIAVCSR